MENENVVLEVSQEPPAQIFLSELRIGDRLDTYLRESRFIGTTKYLKVTEEEFKSFRFKKISEKTLRSLSTGVVEKYYS